MELPGRFARIDREIPAALGAVRPVALGPDRPVGIPGHDKAALAHRCDSGVFMLDIRIRLIDPEFGAFRRAALRKQPSNNGGIRPVLISRGPRHDELAVLQARDGRIKLVAGSIRVGSESLSGRFPIRSVALDVDAQSGSVVVLVGDHESACIQPGHDRMHELLRFLDDNDRTSDFFAIGPVSLGFDAEGKIRPPNYDEAAVVQFGHVRAIALGRNREFGSKLPRFDGLLGFSGYENQQQRQSQTEKRRYTMQQCTPLGPIGGS